MPELEETQPIPVTDLPTEPIPVPVPGIHLGWDADKDGDIDDVEKFAPEPLVLRGAIVTGLGIAGAILGKTFDLSWIDPAIAIYATVAPLGLAVWARRFVTPVKKS